MRKLRPYLRYTPQPAVNPNKALWENGTKPPHTQLIEMATAHWVSRIVYVAAKLDLADHLAKPKSADELAGPTGTHAPSLYRLMRTLAHFGLLGEDGGNASP